MRELSFIPHILCSSLRASIRSFKVNCTLVRFLLKSCKPLSLTGLQGHQVDPLRLIPPYKNLRLFALTGGLLLSYTTLPDNKDATTMKNSLLLLSLLLLSPVTVMAQEFPGMPQMDMQKIQQMQQCMEQIDQQQLKAIEKQQQQFDREIRALCKSGKRDQAQQKAIAYARQMMNNPAIKAMQKCGEIARGMMPEMPVMQMEKELESQHVCDAY
jgi:hypothetical protein